MDKGAEWSAMGYISNDPISAQEVHIMHVYNDPEFLTELRQIYPEMETYHRKLKAAKNMEQQRQLAEQVKAKIPTGPVKELAKEYRIRSADVMHYLLGNIYIWRYYRERYVPYDLFIENDGTCRATFDLNVTKQQFLQIWQLIAANRRGKYNDRIPKPKFPKHDRLLYAIFKARQINTTFPAIYSLYKAKQLPYFENEPPTEFNSLEALSQYYRDYTPKPQTST